MAALYEIASITVQMKGEKDDIRFDGRGPHRSCGRIGIFFGC